MKKKFPTWIIGLVAIMAILIVPSVFFLPRTHERDNPHAFITPTIKHKPHEDLITGIFQSPQEVTLNCLSCHPDAASDVMMTSHWTWQSEPVQIAGQDKPVTVGKINQINGYCIGISGNEQKCSSCHIGYEWEQIESNGAYNFTNTENVDCLVCHANPDLYSKGVNGNPADDVDLVAAAKSVAIPTRENCGECHFYGGGGNNVKHGDLDKSLVNPSEELDVHMGGQDFLCTTCHQTVDHQILGRSLANNYLIDDEEIVQCTDCHSEAPHEDERINAHLDSISCQTCHIPEMAVEYPTMMFWDWSTAGQDLPEDPTSYSKAKGSFVFEKNVIPSYDWFNGDNEYRYLLGDKIDPNQPTYILKPDGEIEDSESKIYPFKISHSMQPYDTTYQYLLQPITAGKDGYWTNFDWDKAFRLAEEVTGLIYSGNFDFTETITYSPTSHMVQPKENALQCLDCHAENGRLDWEELGYPGDPIEWGGRTIEK
jgi:octaheme c-type cytochrome (tetrathionate reductase family)